MVQKSRSEKLKFCRESLSKFFYDLAKASFTAMVVGDTVTMFINETITLASVGLFMMGVIASSTFAFIGYKISMK